MNMAESCICFSKWEKLLKVANVEAGVGDERQLGEGVGGTLTLRHPLHFPLPCPTHTLRALFSVLSCVF